MNRKTAGVPRRLLAAAMVLLGLAGCASPVRTTRLERIDQFSGYRYATLDKRAPKAIAGSAVLMSFSGGGTRAAALAEGALRALARTPVPAAGAAVPLASQIDVISSVSGGSVTSASFALGGIDGLDAFERDFLYSDVMDALITRTLLNPAQLLRPRIDILDDYLDENVFHRRTYADLIAADAPGRQRRPLVVLNATDMASGSVFPFTQDQFDLICADLAQLKIADAVSASAAFPVALSALTIRNRAPCAAQQAAPQTPGTGWQADSGAPVPTRTVNDRAGDVDGGIAYPAAQNLARFRRGTTALTYLNRSGDRDYIQLLDGGLADNIGLTVPFMLLTSPAESPSILSWLNTGKVDKLLFVAVNARTQADENFGERARPPGLKDTLLTTIGAPINANSFQLLGRFDEVIDRRFNPKSLVVIDFDLIADAGCRSHFHNIATSWSLPKQQVRELIELGEAMVLQSPQYREFTAALGAVPPAPAHTVDDICAPYHTPPQPPPR